MLIIVVLLVVSYPAY
ncbi:hypothetical protein LAD25_29505 [Escherichia coli]|nr:hypothetical protein [Escherichia coli]